MVGHEYAGCHSCVNAAHARISGGTGGSAAHAARLGRRPSVDERASATVVRVSRPSAPTILPAQGGEQQILCREHQRMAIEVGDGPTPRIGCHACAQVSSPRGRLTRAAVLQHGLLAWPVQRHGLLDHAGPARHVVHPYGAVARAGDAPGQRGQDAGATLGLALLLGTSPEPRLRGAFLAVVAGHHLLCSRPALC